MVLYGMTYMLSFMKIGIGVHAILRVLFRNLSSCCVGISDGKDL
jgi:hypothetical protein